DAIGLLDGTVDRVAPPLEAWIVLGPHPVDDLAGLLEHSHPFLQFGEAVTVGAPFVFVPAGADAGIQTPVAGDVNRRGDLGVERGVAIPIAPDHLADADALCVADQRRRNRP